ncbi:MAG: hypothetical protein JRN20_09455, partial [Nitrososphaerota archaeon]|nr:hypothetical protein [Nitrososphaerota archaeon]
PTQQFALTVNDPTLAQGQAGSYTVIVNSVNGYSGIVFISAQNVPQGVSISFNPQSVEISPVSPADSTMTVSVSSSAPTGTYSIVVVGTGNDGQTVQSTTFTLMIVGGGGVSFIESGLPSGTLWSATLAGYGTVSSTTDFITFSDVIVDNSYAWSVSSPVSTDSVQYSASPQSGSISVSSSSSSASQSITYSQSTYSVTFANDPLPPTLEWRVTFDGQTKSAYASSSITFVNVPAGSYSWSTATTIPGSAGIQYLASPTSGTISVPSTTFVTIAYVTQYYLSIITPVGSASGSGWYNAGSHASFGVASSIVPSGTDYRYLFDSWTGAAYSGSNPSTNSITAVSAPITETATWFYQKYEITSWSTIVTQSGYYSCASGYTLSGTSCSDTTPGYYTSSTTPGYYSCSQGTLSGSSCLIVIPGYYTTTSGYYTFEWEPVTVWNPGYYSTVTSEVWNPGYYTYQYVAGYWTETYHPSYYTYQQVPNKMCFWSLNAMPQDPQWVCIPWFGTHTVATYHPGYWTYNYMPGYWISVWHPGYYSTQTSEVWNPGHYSTTWERVAVWHPPVTTWHPPVTESSPATWNPPVTTYIWHPPVTTTVVATWNPPNTEEVPNWSWVTIGTL